MQRVLSSELRSHVGQAVRLAGWLHQKRELSRRTFVLLRDRGGLAQILVEQRAARTQVGALLPETVLEVEGRVVASAQAPGGVEVHEPCFEVLSAPAAPPPIDLRRPRLAEQLPTILDHAPVPLRHPRARAAFEIGAASLAGFRATLDALGFTEIQTPKLVASAAESGANVFGL